MGNGKRVAAPNGANCREGVWGATQTPRTGVLRGRQVQEMPETGPAPSRAEPQATQESAGLRRSLRSRVAGEVGAAKHRSQPYSVAERPGHSGASRPSESGPSTASVQGSSRLQPELPGRFDWLTVYLDIQFQRQRSMQLGDVYAFAAAADAVREIDEAVTSALARHNKRTYISAPPSPEEAIHKLRRRRSMAKQRNQQDRVAAIDRSLDGIYRLTHAKAMELKGRDEELRSTSQPHAVSVPERQALGQWLRGQAGAAHESQIERSYFTQLAQDQADGLDPWTVSQRLIGHLPKPGDTDQADRLQAAHRRLVEAMAGRLSPQAAPSGPGSIQLPRDFKWRVAYQIIKVRCETDTQRGDVYAAAAGAGALRAIEEAATAAFIGHHKTKTGPEQSSATMTLAALRQMRYKAKFRKQPDRVAAIDRSLDGIYRLTHAKVMELKHRDEELRSLSPSHAATVPDQQAVGQWLRGQVVTAPKSEIERSYFTHLVRELDKGLDPWTVSQTLIRHLPSPGNIDQAERLLGAHRRLVQAMAGNPPQPQVPPRPHSPASVEPIARESQASASRRQEMVQRLRSSNRLSRAQVEAFRSAVAEAADTGAIGESGSRPEAWAMDLLERIQQSVERPFAGLTALEKGRISADWKRFGELLENLESAGHL